MSDKKPTLRIITGYSGDKIEEFAKSVSTTNSRTFYYPETKLCPEHQQAYTEKIIQDFINEKTLYIITTFSPYVTTRMRLILNHRRLDFAQVIFTFVNQEEIKHEVMDYTSNGFSILPMTFFGCDILDALEFKTFDILNFKTEYYEQDTTTT